MTTEKKHAHTLLVLVLVFWLGGICIGSILLWEHEFSPGENGPAPASIPEALLALSPETKELTILMAIHPDCPCTAASLEQLDRLITRNRDSIQVIGIVRSAGKNEGLETLEATSYWQKLVNIPNAHPLADTDGSLAALLGTKVSGSIVAYDAHGQLRFQGGITASRGHAGPSRGMDELESIARQLATLELCSTPAFGCALENASPSR